jgi:hypothetical protein
MVKVYFTDGTEKVFDKVDIDESELEDNSYLLLDSESKTIAQVNFNFVKYIEW